MITRVGTALVHKTKFGMSQCLTFLTDGGATQRPITMALVIGLQSGRTKKREQFRPQKSRCTLVQGLKHVFGNTQALIFGTHHHLSHPNYIQGLSARKYDIATQPYVANGLPCFAIYKVMARLTPLKRLAFHWKDVPAPVKQIIAVLLM